MLKIEYSRRKLNAYDVILAEPGTGWRSIRITAMNLDEVKTAVDHYFGDGHDNLDIHHCPICRDRQAYRIDTR